MEADGADASTPTEGTATSKSMPPADGAETSPDTSGRDALTPGTETLASGTWRLIDTAKVSRTIPAAERNVSKQLRTQFKNKITSVLSLSATRRARGPNDAE